jgi:biopolymer transport protein ExbD
MLIFFMVAGRISAQKTAAPIALPDAALEQAAAEHAVLLEMTREGALLLDGAD